MSGITTALVNVDMRADEEGVDDALEDLRDAVGDDKRADEDDDGWPHGGDARRALEPSEAYVCAEGRGRNCDCHGEDAADHSIDVELAARLADEVECAAARAAEAGTADGDEDIGLVVRGVGTGG